MTIKIPPNQIRDAAEQIATPLCYLVNMSLQKSLFPSAEKYGKIVPIFKSGRRDVFDDYRPISILPVFSKIIERLVHRQLYSFLENKNLLYSDQYGFRKGRCTSQAVTFLSDYIRMQLNG
jgi:hypothetical protein